MGQALARKPVPVAIRVAVDGKQPVLIQEARHFEPNIPVGVRLQKAVQTGDALTILE